MQTRPNFWTMWRTLWKEKCLHNQVLLISISLVPFVTPHLSGLLWPALDAILKSFEGTTESLITTFGEEQSSRTVIEPFRRITLSLSDHSTLEQSLASYVSTFQAKVGANLVQKQCLFRTLPTHLLIQLNVLFQPRMAQIEIFQYRTNCLFSFFKI